MNLVDRVQFDKPDLRQLNQYHTVVDMHFHSHFSDGLDSIDKIADRARKLNIGVAVTDHNEIQGALKIDEYTDYFKHFRESKSPRPRALTCWCIFTIPGT